MKSTPILFSAPMIRALLSGAKTQTRRVLSLVRAVGEPVAPPGHVLELVYPGSRQHYGYVTPEHERPSWRVQRRCDADCKHVDDVGPYDGRHGFAWGPMPYAPGQRLWVRETWQVLRLSIQPTTGVIYNAVPFAEIPKAAPSGTEWELDYRADGEDPDPANAFRWRPGIHMPRWASRITLEVTEVRVQRLQEISEDDAQAEGVDLGGHPHHRSAFSELWNSINGKPRPMLDDDGEPVLDDNERPIMVASRSWSSNPWVWAISFRRMP